MAVSEARSRGSTRSVGAVKRYAAERERSTRAVYARLNTTTVLPPFQNNYPAPYCPNRHVL